MRHHPGARGGKLLPTSPALSKEPPDVRWSWPGRYVGHPLSDPKVLCCKAQLFSRHWDCFSLRCLSGSLTLQGCLQVVIAAEGKIPVFLDGGVRRGTDVLKALALGAQGVFVSTTPQLHPVLLEKT